MTEGDLEVAASDFTRKRVVVVVIAVRENYCCSFLKFFFLKEIVSLLSLTETARVFTIFFSYFFCVAQSLCGNKRGDDSHVAKRNVGCTQRHSKRIL